MVKFLLLDSSNYFHSLCNCNNFMCKQIMLFELRPTTTINYDLVVTLLSRVFKASINPLKWLTAESNINQDQNDGYSEVTACVV